MPSKLAKGCDVVKLSALANSSTSPARIVLACSDKNIRKALHMAIATLYYADYKSWRRGARGGQSKNDMFDDVSDKISAQICLCCGHGNVLDYGRNLVISAQSAYRPSILLASTSVLDKVEGAQCTTVLQSRGKRMGSRTDPSGGIVAYWKFAEKPDTRNKGEQNEAKSACAALQISSLSAPQMWR